MSALPRSAQLYVVFVCLLGNVAALFVNLPILSGAPRWGWELAVFVSLAIVTSGKKIVLLRRKPEEEACAMSLGFAIGFVAMVRFGPAAGVLVSVAGCLASCLYPRRQATHQISFNLALACLEASLGGYVYVHLSGAGDPGPLRSFRAIAASCLTYFLLNTGAVAIVIALCTGQSARRLWSETLLWTAPSYFVGAGIAALMLVLSWHGVGGLLLFGAPLAYLTYQSYAVTAARSAEKQTHIDELKANKVQLSDLYLATVKSLALAIDAKDQYTHQHILRVQRYAVATARHIGLTGDELEGLNTGALLHDIGKLGVPEYLLLKAGPLTQEEYAKVKKHPEIGAAILDPVEFPWPVLPVVKSHHERWDGTGYPEGLAGEDIPLTARILAVCDVYDALTSDRSYRHAWNHAAALHEILCGAGSQFDPAVVEAFLAVINPIVAVTTGEAPWLEDTAADAALMIIEKAASKADQAARDIQRACADPWTLFEIVGILSAGFDLTETLQCLVEKLEHLYPGTACLFLTRDRAADAAPDALIVRVAVGANGPLFLSGRTSRANGRTLQVARRRETYNGEYDANDLSPSTAAAEWTPLRSALIVPVIYQGEALGTINLYHPQTDAFEPQDRYLLETIADRAATTVYHGLLFDETRTHAFTDPLTGLHNVRYLTQALHRLRDESEGPHAQEPIPFSLLYLDLDRFKSVNDTAGHQQGDRVLRELALAFRGAVRERDIVVRYGGDEFVVVLEGAGALEAEAMAARLLGIVEAYDLGAIHPALGQVRLGVSIGFGCFPRDGHDYETLLSAADAQMYCNKTEHKLGTRLDPAGHAVLRQTLLNGALDQADLTLSSGLRPADKPKGRKKRLAAVRPARRFRFSKGMPTPGAVAGSTDDAPVKDRNGLLLRRGS